MTSSNSSSNPTTVPDFVDLYYAAYYALMTPVIFDIYSYGYIILFILGFLGNISSTLTFARKMLRKVSTSIFFLSLSISDSAYLLTCIYDFVQLGLRIPDRSSADMYQRLCQCRQFIANVAINCSAWTLFSISADRWIRTRFPAKAKSICTQRTATITLVFILLFSAVMNIHFLTPMFGALIPGYTLMCGPSVSQAYSPYYNFYMYYWQIIQAVVSLVIPGILMMLALGDMFFNIQKRRQRLAHH
ncbi:unnamed protein product, partial [Didymodactylos carnosus]